MNGIDLNFGGAIVAKDEQPQADLPNLGRILKVMFEMQRSHEALTQIVVKLNARVDDLERDARMLKARTDVKGQRALWQN